MYPNTCPRSIPNAFFRPRHPITMTTPPRPDRKNPYDHIVPPPLSPTPATTDRHALARRAARLIHNGHSENAVCLKRRSDGAVWRVRLEGRSLIVKGWALTPLRRVESFFRRSPAFRQAQGIRRLARATIDTSCMLGIVRLSNPAFEYLVLDFIPGTSVLELLASGSLGPDRERALAHAVGRLIAQTLDAGVGLRDPKPSNLICRDEPNDPDHPALAVIDCAEAGSKNDACWQARALLAECLGMGICPRRTVMLCCLRHIEPDRTRRHALWRRVERSLAGATDLTPRNDPLQQPTAL